MNNYYNNNFYELSEEDIINLSANNQHNHYFDDYLTTYRSVSIDIHRNIDTFTDSHLDNNIDSNYTLDKPKLSSHSKESHENCFHLSFKDLSKEIDRYVDNNDYKIPDITNDSEWNVSIAPTLSNYHFICPIDSDKANEEIVNDIDLFLSNVNIKYSGISLTHSYNNETSEFNCILINELTNELCKFIINIYKKSSNDKSNLLIEWRRMQGSNKAFIQAYNDMKSYFNHSTNCLTNSQKLSNVSVSKETEIYLSIDPNTLIVDNATSEVIDISTMSLDQIDSYIVELTVRIDSLLVTQNISTYCLFECLTNLLFLLKHRLDSTIRPSNYMINNKSLVDVSLNIERKALKRLKQINSEMVSELTSRSVNKNQEIDWLVVTKLARRLANRDN